MDIMPNTIHGVTIREHGVIIPLPPFIDACCPERRICHKGDGSCSREFGTTGLPASGLPSAFSGLFYYDIKRWIPYNNICIKLSV